MERPGRPNGKAYAYREFGSPAADRVLAEPKPSDDELAALRSAFVAHMVRVNDRGEYVRRSALWDALPPKSQALLERLAGARLLIVGSDVKTVEVAHEALLRNWPRLRKWLDEASEFLMWRERLSQAHADYKAERRGPLTGKELDIARGWMQSEHEIDSADQQFIRTSIDADDKQKGAKEDAERESLEQRLRAAEQIAEEQKRAVENLREAQTAQSRFLADMARQKREAGDAASAVLLALEALPDNAAGIERPYVLEAEVQLDGASRERRERLVLGHEGLALSAAFSPDGQRIVTASSNKTARLWDAATGKPIGGPLKGHEAAVLSAAFSPDGQRIVTASDGQDGARLGRRDRAADRRAAQRP